MSEFDGAATWLIYALAAVVMISAAAAAILLGLALRLVAEFLRELGYSREGDGTPEHNDGRPKTAVRAQS